MKHQADATKMRIEKMSTNEFWDRYRWAIIAAPAIALLLFIIWSSGAEAEMNLTSEGRTCYEVGAFMEVAEETHDPMRKSRQWQAWLRLAQNVGQERIIRMARNAHQSGMTADQMYRTCPHL